MQEENTGETSFDKRSLKVLSENFLEIPSGFPDDSEKNLKVL